MVSIQYQNGDTKKTVKVAWNHKIAIVFVTLAESQEKNIIHETILC